MQNGESSANPCPCQSRSDGGSIDTGMRLWQGWGVIDAKYAQLCDGIRKYGSCLVAYSGGVDSAFLAYVTHRVLGKQSLAAIADSPSLPRRELEEALELGRQFEFPVRVVRTREFEDTNYLSNPSNRCFFCKQALFMELAPLAQSEGYAVLAYGENASDVGDYRPGAQAAARFQVRAPLKEFGLTKAEIRELSAKFGLPTADKPQMACLSSRIPYGEGVTPAKLLMIEQAENFLKDLGFYDVRVRHHELKGGALARLELGATEIGRMFQENLLQATSEALKRIGFTQVTLDLEGYRRGSLNPAVHISKSSS